MRIAFFCVAVGLFVTSCSQSEHFNRGYVISHSKIDEEKPSEEPHALEEINP